MLKKKMHLFLLSFKKQNTFESHEKKCVLNENDPWPLSSLQSNKTHPVFLTFLYRADPGLHKLFPAKDLTHSWIVIRPRASDGKYKVLFPLKINDEIYVWGSGENGVSSSYCLSTKICWYKVFRSPLAGQTYPLYQLIKWHTICHLKYILDFPYSHENLTHKLHQPFLDNLVLECLHGMKESLVTSRPYCAEFFFFFSPCLDFVEELGKAWVCAESLGKP